MNLLFKSYYIFSVLFILLPEIFIGQEIREDSCDYQKIDSYLTENYIKQEADCINILYSSNDCEKCILYLNSVLRELKGKQDDIIVNVISDNVVFTKKKLKEYKVPINYYYDKDLFSNFGIEYKTKVYLKTKKGIIISDIEKILNYLHYEVGNDGELVLKLSDSIITPYKMISTVLPFSSLMTFDPQMGVAVLFKGEKNNLNTFEPYYIESVIKDSLKLYNLPERIPLNSGLKKVELSEFSIVSKENMIPFIKIHSLSSLGSKVYCNFAISRLYKKEEGGNYALLTNSFIGVKEINKEDNLFEVMNVDTYEDIYQVDVFDYEGDEYPMSIWITDGISVIDENTIMTKVNKVIPTKDELGFGGLATIKLIPSTQTAKMISLNPNVENVIKRTNIVKTKKFNYYIKKEMIDNENNYGVIKITRFSNDKFY